MKGMIILIGLLFSISLLGADVIDFAIGTGTTVALPLKDVSASENKRLLDKNFTEQSYLIEHANRSERSLKSGMTPAKFQGKRGTCSAFATIGLIEYYGGGDLSEQCLAKLSSDKDSGKVDQRISWAIENGVYFEKDCPYNDKEDGRDIVPGDLTRFARRWPYGPYYYQTQSISDPLTYIRAKIDVGNPISIAVFVAG